MRAATLQGISMGLDSFQSLLQMDSSLKDNAINLLHKAYDDFQHYSPHVIGVISESAYKRNCTWVFFQPNDDIFEGADAVAVSLEKPELGNSDQANILIENDKWRIISKEPLLMLSMYSAIIGFKRTVEGVFCHAVDEGDADDWGQYENDFEV